MYSNDEKYGICKSLIELSSVKNSKDNINGPTGSNATLKQITIILNLDIVPFEVFTDAYYITKIFNNKNYVIGLTSGGFKVLEESKNQSTSESKNQSTHLKTPIHKFPESVYTRFEHVYIKKCPDLIYKCNRYLARKNLSMDGSTEIPSDVFIDTIDTRFYLIN